MSIYKLSKTAEGGNPSKLRKIAVVFCAAALAGANAKAAATYTTEDDGETLVVTVDSDGATMDAAQVTAGITKIKKEGPGQLVASPLTSYEGDFSLEEGIFRVKADGDLGKKSFANKIYVNDGASIVFACTTGGLFDNKDLEFAGLPASEGVSGANQVSGKLTFDPQTGSTWTAPKIGANMKITLKSDAAFVKVSGSRLVMGGTFDLGGHVLTLDGKSSQMDVYGTFSNGGGVVVNNSTTWMTESGAITFDAASAGTGYVEVRTGATLNMKKDIHEANGWKLYIKGATLTANTTNAELLPTKTEYSAWNGPVDFQNKSIVSAYAGDNDATHSKHGVYNIKGAISGSGTLAVGPSWLNIFSQDNTYSGAVTVKSESAYLTRVGGIGVWNGAACFPNASSITFTEKARFAFMDNVPASVPTLTFASDDAQSINGGHYASRPSMSGIVKSGTGVLTVNSPVHVTGKARVAGGALKVASSRPGLFEYHVKQKNAPNDQNYIYSSSEGYGFCRPWDETYLQHINIDECGVNEVCAAKTYNCDVSTGWGDGETNRNGYWYKGYVWNHSDSPATWKVWCGVTTGVSIWLGEDHSQQVEFRGFDSYRPASAQEITLQPGATPIDIFVWGNGDAFWGHVFKQSSGSIKRYGLVVARGETSFTTAEFNALLDNLKDYRYNSSAYQDSNGSTFIKDFVAKADEFELFGDEGTGELFTATNGADPDADPEVLAAQQPVFDDIEFAHGTTFDLSGNRIVRIKDLTGSPEVVNSVKMTVTNNWTICAADFPKDDATVHHPMTVDGKLYFAEGATFSIDVEASICRSSSGIVVATAAGGIVGSPRQAAGLAKQWKLEASGNNLVLRGASGFLLLVK